MSTSLVPGAGLEPATPNGGWILSPLRMPFRHPGIYKTNTFKNCNQLCYEFLYNLQRNEDSSDKKIRVVMRDL